jgi:tetratricopeptide (TPR) repeat protein
MRSLLSALGFSKVENDDGTPRILTNDDHNRVYRQACDLIDPYMRLHNVAEKPIDATARTNLEKGIRLLEAVTEYHPGNWNAFWIIGKAKQALGDSPGACDSFGRAFAIQKQNPDVAREYMFECLNLGRGREGLDAAKLAVEIDPKDAGLYANLALAHLVAGDAQAAMAAVDQAIQMNPADEISQNVKRMTQKIIDGKIPLPKKLGDLSG